MTLDRYFHAGMDSCNPQIGGDDKPHDINTQNNQRTYDITKGTNLMCKTDNKWTKAGSWERFLYPCSFRSTMAVLGAYMLDFRRGAFGAVKNLDIFFRVCREAHSHCKHGTEYDYTNTWAINRQCLVRYMLLLSHFASS